jgi:hypothetical protein
MNDIFLARPTAFTGEGPQSYASFGFVKANAFSLKKNGKRGAFGSLRPRHHCRQKLTLERFIVMPDSILSPQQLVATHTS